jgi:hypothetical protein
MAKIQTAYTRRALANLHTTAGDSRSDLQDLTITSGQQLPMPSSWLLLKNS